MSWKAEEPRRRHSKTDLDSAVAEELPANRSAAIFPANMRPLCPEHLTTYISLLGYTARTSHNYTANNMVKSTQIARLDGEPSRWPQSAVHDRANNFRAHARGERGRRAGNWLLVAFPHLIADTGRRRSRQSSQKSSPRPR